eukprot:8142861-Pyramimonas_sp.AAC.1
MGFPPVVLGLEPLQCVACRCLLLDGAASEPLQPRRSVVQGLWAGARFARIMAYFAMRQVTTASLQMGHRLW